MLNESIRPVHTACASRLFGVKQNHDGALGATRLVEQIVWGWTACEIHFAIIKWTSCVAHFHRVSERDLCGRRRGRCRGASLIRNTPPVGSFSSPVPKDLR